MERVVNAVKWWIEDRPTMKEDNHRVGNVIGKFCGEVSEFCDAAGSKSLDEMRESIDVREELGDLGLYLLSIFELLGLDFTEVCMEKMAINMLRMPAFHYQGDEPFPVTYQRDREYAKKTGMKKQFYAQ